MLKDILWREARIALYLLQFSWRTVFSFRLVMLVLEDEAGLIDWFDWRMLGLGLCRAFFLVCFVLLSSMSEQPGQLMALFWGCPALVGLFVACLCGRRGIQIGERVRCRRVLIATLIASVILLLSSLYLESHLLAMFGAVIGGMCSMLLYVCWSARLSRLSGEEVAVYVAFGMALAGGILLVVNAVPNSAIFFLVGLGVLLAGPFMGGLSLGEEAPCDARSAQGSLAIEGKWGMRDLFSRTNVAALAIPFAYHFAVMTFVETSLFNRDVEGVLVALLSLLIVFCKPRLGASAMLKSCLPAIVASYLLVLALPSMSSTFAIISGSGLKLAEIFIWVAIINSARFDAAKGPVNMLVGVSCMFAGRGLAFVLSEALAMSPWNQPAVAAYVLVVFLILVYLFSFSEDFAVAFHAGGRDPVHAFEKNNNKQRTNGTLDRGRVLDEIARKYSLTVRERDVLGYLSQGRNRAYIAEALGISEGTVHVHATHLYQKLGIHGQQELITFVEKHES